MELQNGQRDFRIYFKKQENQVTPFYSSFEKPEYFDNKLQEI